MKLRLLALLLFCLSISRVSFAGTGLDATSESAGVWTDPGWRRVVAREAVTFEESGARTSVSDFEIRALDDRGARKIAQMQFSYNSYFDGLSLSDLATIKADGRVIPVATQAIKDQPSTTDRSSPYFDEERVRLVAFSAVDIGDSIKGHVVIRSKRPLFEKAFVGTWSQPLDQPPETMLLTINGPASRPLHISARDAIHEQRRVGNRIIHQVRFVQEAGRVPPAQTDAIDSARRFDVSTFPDYAAFAATIGKRNAPMAIPDAAVVALAHQIVGDAGDTRTKAERIYTWVASTIRYVGIGLTDGGWVSQPAGAILSARYGDCKAHATILKALLAAVGVPANLVVVNAGAQYTLSEVATSSFNHAIAYVPSLDLYLDPTSARSEFGTLPFPLYGKPVLNIDTGALSRIPNLKAENFRVVAETQYTLRPDGSRQALSLLSGTGVGASLDRRVAEVLQSQDRAQEAARLIREADLTGSGTYDFPNSTVLSNAFAIRAKFDITSALNLGAFNRVRMLPLTDPRPPLRTLVIGGETSGAFVCASMEYEDIASLTIPDGSHVSERPGSRSITKILEGDTPYGHVKGRIDTIRSGSITASTVKSDTRITFSFNAPVCPQSFAEEIRKALSTFYLMERDPIGITPKSVDMVTDSGSDYDMAVAALRAGRYETALALWRTLADQNNTDAQVAVGLRYQYGQGVAQDVGEAFRWYLKAAALGDPLGQSHVAWAYENGFGVPRSVERANFWYRRSAANGSEYSDVALGNAYAAGRGVPKDIKQAIRWYEKAAEHGSAKADVVLGALYQQGSEVPQDYAMAALWYRKAADQGDAQAQLDLGLLYVYGQGVPFDYGTAAKWFRKSADQGFAAAQFNLGWMYENGFSVARDKRLAEAWYGKAAELGHAEARERLDILNGATWAGLGWWPAFTRGVWWLFH